MAVINDNDLGNLINGTNNPDEIFGNGGSDTINGGDGADTINGGDGGDVISGGSGDDSILGGDSGDEVNSVDGSDGNDIIVGGNGFDVLDGSADNDTLKGGGDTDLLFGGSGNDLLQGEAGNDELFGDLGNDILEGGEGHDLLDGGQGSDQLTGGNGNDTYLLTDALDTVVELGSGGEDTIKLGFKPAQPYALVNNVENLQLEAAAQDSSVVGNGLDNYILGNNVANGISGLDGDDTLYGLGGNDTLSGGNGRDTLASGAGNDTLSGGDEGDRFVFSDIHTDGIDQINDFNVAEDIIAFDIAASAFDLNEPPSQNTGYNQAGLTPEAFLSAAQFTVGTAATTANQRVIYDNLTGKLYFDRDGVGGTAQVQIATLAAGLNLTNAHFYAFTRLRPIDNPGQSGTANADVFNGTAGDDLYYGLGGNDNISGFNGKDEFDGGTGDDSINGGAGDDTLLGGAGGDTLFGGSDGDILSGGAGNDRLDGGSGIDNLQGGAGNDTYVVDNIADQVFETSLGGDPGGIDQVFASVTTFLNGNIENLTLTGPGAINGSGNNLANFLAGNDATNILYGAGGNDTLTGGDGNDRFQFGDPTQEGIDTITDFEATDDIIAISAGGFFANVDLPTNSFIASTQFRAGTSAVDVTDRFIYDAATGKLYFDADGSGAIAQVQLATLSSKPTLTHNNFFVFNNGNQLPAGPGNRPNENEPPTLTIGDVTLVEGNNGTTNAVFTVSLSTASATPVTVNYATQDGSAIAGSDYAASNGVLTFAAGQTTQTITIQVTGDTVFEGNEAFSVRLSGATNAAIADGVATGTITNDDTIPDPNQGTAGNDILTGSNGRETLSGGDGNDTLLGLNGNDNLLGGNGNDNLRGGAGNDTLRGGNGNDRIWGGLGSDTIFSGGGRDIIALQKGVGRDVIKDFSDRFDKLGLTPGLSYGQLTFIQQGKNTIISAGSDQLAILIGVNKAKLSRADFTAIAAG